LTYFQQFPGLVDAEACALDVYAQTYVLLQQHQANNPYHPHDHDDNDDHNSTSIHLLPSALVYLFT